MKLSIIVPCYNEESCIEAFYSAVDIIVQKLCSRGVLSDYEFLFIDDGSRDGTLSGIKKIAGADRHIFYISFTRNFGKEAAMLAGLSRSSGDYVTIMDVDLQDPPECLEEMLDVLVESTGGGYECVACRRTNRSGEPWMRSAFARLFYWLINKCSDIEMVSGVRDFRLMSRRMVDSILTLKEKNRFSKGLFVWAGYKTYYLEYKNVRRANGETKWSFWKLLKYSLDGITGFSLVPLQFATVMGFLFCIVSFLAVLFFVAQKVFVGIPIQGYAMLVCAIFSLSGIQLLCLGIVGQYIGKLFVEAKRRPDYVVLESNLSMCENSRNIQ